MMVALPAWRYDRDLHAVCDDGGRTIAHVAPGDDALALDGEAPVGPLLAAAPDLKLALQALVDALTNAEPDHQLSDQIMIVEAIAKAGHALMKSERGG